MTKITNLENDRVYYLSDHPKYIHAELTSTKTTSTHHILGVWETRNKYRLFIHDKDKNIIAEYCLERSNYKLSSDFLKDVDFCRKQIKRIHGIPLFD